MRGVLVFVSAVAVASLTTACQDDSNPGPMPPSSTAQASASPTVDATGAAAELGVPEFSGDLPVDLVIGLQMLGLGCRQTTPRDACTVDGLRTYSWVGQKHPVDLTTARMRPAPDHGSWVVTLRFARGDGSSVTRAAARAGAMGGYALLLDQDTGDALGAVQPAQVQGGRVVVENLSKPDAWDLVTTYVTAATQR
jgi:hypothetical protein